MVRTGSGTLVDWANVCVEVRNAIHFRGGGAALECLDARALEKWQALARNAKEWQAVASNGKTDAWTGFRPLRPGSEGGDNCTGALEARNRGREPHGFVKCDSSCLCNSFGS